MNIWDSVHRGLEKATHEAARLAKTQRLRSISDNLSRQINAQQTLLITRAMELFTAGQLTQGELLPICQELANLQQQLEQAQTELKSLPPQPGQLPPPGVTTPFPGQPAQGPSGPYTPGADLAPTAYAPPPPDYQLYFDTTMPTTPPPPPGIAPLTVSAMETISLAADAQPAAGQCPNCHAELIPGNAYCHNCGSLVQHSDVAHLPTVRGGTLEPIYPVGQETMRAPTSLPTFIEKPEIPHSDLPPQETVRSSSSLPTFIEPKETTQGDPPSTNTPPESAQSTEHNGGQ
jgi:hypothetical protein